MYQRFTWFLLRQDAHDLDYYYEYNYYDGAYMEQAAAEVSVCVRACVCVCVCVCVYVCMCVCDSNVSQRAHGILRADTPIPEHKHWNESQHGMRLNWEKLKKLRKNANTREQNVLTNS